MRSRTLHVLLACASAALSTSCDRKGQPEEGLDPVTNPLFSPDGSHVAVLWESLTPGFSIGPEPRYVREAAYVRWGSSRGPQDHHQIELASVKLQGERVWLSRQYHLAFSPDSAHLAIAGLSDIMLIDMATGKHWKMDTTGQAVSSFVWLDKDRICYVLQTGKRVFCSQGIEEAASQRKVVYEGPPDASQMEADRWPLEHWSADAQHVIFLSEKGTYLVDLATQSARRLGRKRSLIGVSWSPDSRKAFCLACDYSGYEALLVFPDKDETTDVSAPFNREFGKDSFSESAFARPGESVPSGCWTPDGRYLVLNVFQRGAFLLQPEPWELIPVGQRVNSWLARQSPATFGLPPHYSLTGEGYDPHVYPLSTRGVLLCDLPRVGRDCLADYGGNVVSLLPRVDWMGVGAGPSVSPDGRLTAYATTPGRVILHELLLAASEPASSTREQGTGSH